MDSISRIPVIGPSLYVYVVAGEGLTTACQGMSSEDHKKMLHALDAASAGGGGCRGRQSSVFCLVCVCQSPPPVRGGCGRYRSSLGEIGWPAVLPDLELSYMHSEVYQFVRHLSAKSYSIRLLSNPSTAKDRRTFPLMENHSWRPRTS